MASSPFPVKTDHDLGPGLEEKSGLDLAAEEDNAVGGSEEWL